MKIKAKKSLGQNFLIDQEIIDKILNCSEIKQREILEIGPGTGSLTKEIIKFQPKKITLIEKDKFLATHLKENLLMNVEIINEDVLKINFNNLSNEKLIVFGNLPYNISTKILLNCISSLNVNVWFEKLIFMFQKEVANRIVSSHDTSTFGRLSVISQLKLDIEKKFDIKPNSFYPKPKVDSTVLVFTPKKEYKDICTIKSLEKITKIFFNQRRKKIKKSLNQIFKDPDKIAKKLNINVNLRPQNLNCEIYFKLAKELDELRC